MVKEMTLLVFRSQPTRGQVHHTGTPEAFRGMLESLIVLAQTVLSGQFVWEYESKPNAVPMEHIAFPSVASWTPLGPTLGIGVGCDDMAHTVAWNDAPLC